MDSSDDADQDAHGALMRKVLAHAPSMQAYWGRDLRCRFANPASAHWFEEKPQGLVGTLLDDLLGPALLASHQPHLRAVLLGSAQTLEHTILCPGGVQRRCLVHYLPDIVDGEVRGFVSQLTDLTALKAPQVTWRDQAAAHEPDRAPWQHSEATWRRVQRLARIGSWSWNRALKPSVGPGARCNPGGSETANGGWAWGWPARPIPTSTC